MSKLIKFISALSLTLAPLAAHADEQSDRIAAIQVAYNLSEGLKNMTPEEASHVQGMSEKPKKCLAALDAMGEVAEIKIQYQMQAVTMSSAEARAMCEQLLIDARKFETAVGGREASERAEVEAKYKKAGIKGKRLKLFVDNELNGGGFAWYGKGCATEITDPKALKKAKKLFQWTNGSGGSTLVTKYTFSGNKYKVSSREFYSTAKAQRWCR